ncbi:MAG TPA: phosphohistidine phosphatase SixA [Ignavibacteriaceae bacterium]|nr:phosphohistidine phosphatase SixA [Ignavibacteriaceae bacterium]
MNLYLIRHSIAEKISPVKNDFNREITQEGKDLLKDAASYWKKIIQGFDLIIVSPLTRAVQTSDIIADSFGYNREVIKDNNLATGAKTSALIEILNTYGLENIACIGHQPDLSFHVSNLISNNGCVLHFPPAAICKIRFTGSAKFSKGELIYLIPPEIFKQ